MLSRLQEGVLRVWTDAGPRYVRPSALQRIYLVWTFRNFSTLPEQVLNRRQRAIVNKLCSDSSHEVRAGGNAAHNGNVIGTVDRMSGSWKKGTTRGNTLTPLRSVETSAESRTSRVSVPASAPLVWRGNLAESTPMAATATAPQLVGVAEGAAKRETTPVKAAQPRTARIRRVRWPMVAIAAALIIAAAAVVVSSGTLREVSQSTSAAIAQLAPAPQEAAQVSQPLLASQAAPEQTTAPQDATAPQPAQEQTPALQQGAVPQGPQQQLASAQPSMNPPAVPPANNLSANPEPPPSPSQTALQTLPQRPREAKASAVSPSDPPQPTPSAPVAKTIETPAGVGADSATASATPPAASTRAATSMPPRLSPETPAKPASSASAKPEPAHNIATVSPTSVPRPANAPKLASELPASPPPAAQYLQAPEARPKRIVYPDYPSAARPRRTRGTVALNLLVGADGAVQKVNVVSGEPVLAKAATQAVKQWRYEPRRVDGTAVEFQTTVRLNFFDTEVVSVDYRRSE